MFDTPLFVKTWRNFGVASRDSEGYHTFSKTFWKFKPFASKELVSWHEIEQQPKEYFNKKKG